MRFLPTLVTPHGAFELPLSRRAAEQIIAAWVAWGEPESEARVARQLAAGIELDPTFALWTVCRAWQSGLEPHSVPALGQWLAGGMHRELTWPAAENAETAGDPHDAGNHASTTSLPTWAELAAQCVGTARLAARLAEHKSLDVAHAYLLGLLHAAPKWFTGAAITGEALSALLPDWLRAELSRVEAHNGRASSCVTDCVAAALRLADPKRRPLPGWSKFKFDRRRYAAEMAGVRQVWLAETTITDVVPALVEKLKRLAQLNDEFQRTLEHEKLESLKELAYGAGHEINNPLANISARAQTLLQDERDPQRRRKLAAIHTQAFRAHEMIADMMLFARPPQPKLAAVDLPRLLAELIEELAPAAAEQQTELLLYASADAARLSVAADKTQLAVAVRALAINSLEALGNGGRIELALKPAESAQQLISAESRAPGETVQITLSDNGPGIAPEVRPHIFDPFYSGREAGRGLGFGLSKCWRIVSMHGGRIDVDSRPGHTVFTLTLPAQRSR